MMQQNLYIQPKLKINKKIGHSIEHTPITAAEMEIHTFKRT